MNELKRKAYIGKFLVPLHVPDAFLANEAIQEIYGVYKNL